MIISDDKKFVFVHIPKCAGTSVRSFLQSWDQAEGKFTARIDNHSELGTIDYVHIPLFVLREHFPTEYEKVSRYFSISVVRDPFRRFPSSFSQHLKKITNGRTKDISHKEVRKTVDSVIDTLRSFDDEAKVYLPYRFIHFQRQIDYVFDQGEQLITKLYDISEVDELLEDLDQKVGIRGGESESVGSTEKANESIVYRNDFVALATKVATPVLRVFVPSSRVRKRFRESVESLLYVPRDARFRDVFESAHVRDFVESYYSEDIKLVESVRNE